MNMINLNPNVYSRRKFMRSVGLGTASLIAAPVNALTLPVESVNATSSINGINDETQLIPKQELDNYVKSIKEVVYKDYIGMYHMARGILKYPFITPGSVYKDELWDWDSWLSNIALRQILSDIETQDAIKEALPHEQGCVLNFLKYGGQDGWVPIVVRYDTNPVEDKPSDIYSTNMHKPVLAQHAAFLVKGEEENAEWLRDDFWKMEAFIENYSTHSKHMPTGLYFWQDDVAIGVDNDPSTFYRPKRSSGSILLNCFMYKELEAMAYISKLLKMEDKAKKYSNAALKLKSAIREYCWDERDGFYYSVDLNLLPINNNPGKYLGMELVIHGGRPRQYHCLIQRLGVWSGFLPMWCRIASYEEASRIVREHFNNKNTFNAPYGIRTLSKLEKMYSIYPSSNPSDWQGPIWIIVNYFVFKGLLNYGFFKEAKEIAAKTIRLLGMDAEKEGAFHEYYNPESGEPIINKGFQNWNYLVMNMIAWLEKRPVVEEF